MATVLLSGQTKWSMTRDSDGYRTYSITFRVRSNSSRDGPANVLRTAGLPRPGQPWAVDNDLDIWAWCRPDVTIKPDLENEPNYYWTLDFTFSNKPLERSKCQDDKQEDPLLEPMKLSGSFTKYQEEATTDRFGLPITSSSWELMRGANIEFDRNRPQIKIEQNVASLNLPLVARMIDCVNDSPLWGLPRRCVKLSNFSWERKYHGRCYRYFTRSFEFDVNYETFDRDILDEGTKALKGRWDSRTGNYIIGQIGGKDANPFNPQHFERFKDRAGENCRVILNGRGLPAGVTVGTSGSVSGKFVSATYPPAVFNIGHPLTDPSYWLPLVGTFNPTADWKNDIVYVRGNVVKTTEGTFICHNDCLVKNEPPPVPPFQQNSFWTKLFRPVGPLVFEDKGTYNASTDYENGQYVIRQGLDTVSGYVHIEKYPEVNFLLLGIPATLE